MLRHHFFLVLIMLCALGETKPFKRIKDYKQYLKKWQQIVSKQNIHDASSSGQVKQQCYGQKCKFFYYEYKAPRISSQIYNRTVLLVSGMHGNEYLGPHVLLYGYKYFKAAHIIYFPMANPSGFLKNQRLTFPQKIDPNRDFPIDGNKQCYKTSSTYILDNLYRKYKIDLTVVLHNGGNQIAFNWGDNSHLKNSHTQDYDIQLAIALMMKRVGGVNKKLGIEEFKVGTMNEIIYPAPGTFDDWAYAAGKFPQLITNCKGLQYIQYPANMANGLVFIIQLGPHNKQLLGSEEAISISDNQQSQYDGYVSRGIRIIRQLLQITFPTLSIQWGQQSAFLTANGCSSGTLNDLQIIQYNSNNISSIKKVFNLQNPIEIQGTVRQQLSRPFKIQYQNKISKLTESKIYYSGHFICSQDWIGKGTTFFAQKRNYSFAINVTRPNNDNIFKKSLQNNAKQSQKQEQISLYMLQSPYRQYAFYTISIIVVLALMSAIFAVLRCICAPVQVKRQQKFAEMSNQEYQSSGDLHTARGGIIQENV